MKVAALLPTYGGQPRHTGVHSLSLSDTLTTPVPRHRFPARLAQLAGWRRLAVAAGFGGLATFALPPACAVPLLLIAFPGLLWLLDGERTGRQAFAVGWFFGFAHHLLGLYWISAALFTDIGRFWWALPLSAAGLPVLLSMFTGFATLLVWKTRATGLARVVLFAASWALFEWLRGHVFTGFPWNLIGYGWTGFLPVLQSVSLFGIYGLSLLTALVGALPAALGDPALPPRRAWGALAAGLALFVGLGVWGELQLAGAPTETVPGVRLRLVQPAIDQRLKWAPGERVRNVQQQLDLSAEPPSAPSAEPPTHIIWSETAVPLFMEQDARVRQALGSVTPPGGLVITGAPRVTMGADGEQRYYNSLLAVDGSGAIAGSFDKFHLVPFGEYMPLRNWLPVGAIAGNGAEFSAGPGPVTLDLKGLPPVSPLICYEVIFPGAVVDHAHRPQWMLNLTNDAWYGNTAGPHQHFAIAQTRAVEEGLPLVRVANTGISGVVDAYGRVTAMLGLGQRGIVDAALPKARPAPTLYGWVGDGLFGVMLLFCLALGLLARQRR